MSPIGDLYGANLGDSFFLGILLLQGQSDQLPSQAFRSCVPPPPPSICSGLLLQRLECPSRGTHQCHSNPGVSCPGIPQVHLCSQKGPSLPTRPQ